jgi:hypothetical protein
MKQSQQDDNYDALELFAEQSFVFLTLVALKRNLNTDEVWLLEKAARTASLSSAPSIANPSIGRCA